MSGPDRAAVATADADGHAAGLRTDGDPVDDLPDYIDRHLSELDYTGRVLARARDEDRPLFERVRSLMFFTTLTDELFRVRVAERIEMSREGSTQRSRGGRTPAEEVAELRRRFVLHSAEQQRIWREELRPALADAGIHVRRWEELTDDERKVATARFDDRIFPVLTPLAVGPAHPFPFISDLSLSVGVVLRDHGGEPWFVRIKVPPLLERLVQVTDVEGETVFVPVEDVIGAHLDRLLPGRDVIGWHTFRVTRNADYDVEEVEDLRAAVTSEIFERRFGRVVRLELDDRVPDEVRSMLLDELDLTSAAVVEQPGLLDLSLVEGLTGLDRPELAAPRWRPMEVKALAGDLFATLRRRDVLVHHPYESFESSTLRFIEQASTDSRVLAMKMTLYRTSGDSPIVAALIRAARSGKQVVALIELKARFDEEANIEWSRKLEEAGVHVVYGFVELKTHTKTALVVRQDEGGIRRYAHIATGNYNPSTARFYEDVGVLTADPEVTHDLGELFNMLTGHSRRLDTTKLVVAPTQLLPRLLELIASQAHPDGRIVMKMNNISHEPTIDALEAASQAGASIDLIVRSICCLRPGLPGRSENIRVRSKVGDVLEHSRIYRFGHDPAPGAVLLGSADLMTRNLEKRVEAVVPIDDPDLRARIDEMLEALLMDDTSSWTLAGDGTWTRVPTERGIDAQQVMRDAARERRG